MSNDETFMMVGITPMVRWDTLSSWASDQEWCKNHIDVRWEIQLVEYLDQLKQEREEAFKAIAAWQTAQTTKCTGGHGAWCPHTDWCSGSCEAVKAMQKAYDLLDRFNVYSDNPPHQEDSDT